MKKILFLCAILLLNAAVLTAAGKSKDDYIKDLSSDDPATVVAAEKYLGEKKEKSVVDKLTDLLQNASDKDVRMNAAVALGLIGEKKVIDTCIDQILVERNSDVRYALVLAVTRLGVETKAQGDKLVQVKENETDPIIIDYLTKIEEKIKGKK
ncbi:MAG: HEAT repeat domain-containing protein [Spirochaetes bacterium]|nr:HEAT repeat domain-containing protein [Spirochaetota bacterium]